jgi:hypothetical protein
MSTGAAGKRRSADLGLDGCVVEAVRPVTTR